MPVVATVALDDPHAATLHQQFAIGFAGEVLRTDYLAKQLVREIEVGGRRYGDGPRAAAREPTVLIMGGARRARRPTSRGVALKGSFGGEDEHPDALAIAVDAYPDHDRALPQTLAGALGLLAASRVADTAAPNARASAGDGLRARAGGRRARMAGGGGARGLDARRTPARPRSASCSRPCARIALR